MKTNYLKSSIALVAVLAMAITVKAQKSSRTDSNADRYNSHHYVSYNDGKRTESIQTSLHDKTYRMELVNKKMTELYVNDVKIPESKWGEYSKAIVEIKEQIRKDEVQARKDQAQALKDQAQARVDQVQARKDQAQARVDQEQAQRDQIEAKKRPGRSAARPGRSAKRSATGKTRPGTSQKRPGTGFNRSENGGRRSKS